MLAVLFTLTPGCRNEFIDCQKAKVHIAVHPIMDEDMLELYAGVAQARLRFMGIHT